MKEIKQIVEAYDRVDFSVRKAAMATVVKVTGSAYRRPGARMLITDDGRWTGAVSGGCLEGDALRKAKSVMIHNQPQIVTYDTMDDNSDNSIAVGLGCNGIVDILIEPIQATTTDVVSLLKEFIKSGEVAVLATVIRASQQTIGLNLASRLLIDVHGNNFTFGLDHIYINLFEEEAKLALVSNKSTYKTFFTNETETEVLFEVLKPGLQLVIFGGGYDAAPVVNIGSQLGWEVTVTDDCVAHLGAKRFPGACQVLMAPRSEIATKIAFKKSAAAVLMSHNFEYDYAVFKELLTTSVNYIGLVGPKKRFDKMVERLSEEGIQLSSYDKARIFAPVGLNIGAETPDEIALSIASEIQAFFNDKTGTHLRDLTGPIHDRYQFENRQKSVNHSDTIGIK